MKLHPFSEEAQALSLRVPEGDPLLARLREFHPEGGHRAPGGVGSSRRGVLSRTWHEEARRREKRLRENDLLKLEREALMADLKCPQ